MPNLLSLYLPALVPSWRFFKTVGPSPRIEYRVDGGDWVGCEHRPEHVRISRMLRRMLWNPRWNEQLYLVSLSERLASDPDQADHAVRELAERIIRLGSVPPGAVMEFRVIFLAPEGDRIGLFVEYESLAKRVPDDAV
ncbi:hypothetical protein [Tropicibacter sp. S64]|uniref:hypothetical protein n=1 Tax=Tropicibacter sp. S64 TaxID=3415122 RepID=UPI003C7D1BBD